MKEAMPAINKMCTGATILNGYTSNSGSTSEIQKWLHSIYLAHMETVVSLTQLPH